MKIGFIISNIYQLGGVERVASLLCRIFSEDLHCEVTLLSCFTRPGEGKNTFQYPENVKIVHLCETLCPKSRFSNTSLYKIIYLKYHVLSMLKKYQKAEPQDILISTVCWCNCFVPLIKGSARHISCEHGLFMAMPFIYRIASRIFYRFSDAVVLLSQRSAKFYPFVKEHKLFIIPNPLSFIPEIQSDCSAKRILSLTRFTHEKGNDLLIEIAKMLKEQLPDWKIDVFGSGPEEEVLKKRASGLKDFLYFRKPTSEVIQEMSHSGIYILYSRNEGLSMVLLEAQACGLPSVTFDCDCGPSEIIENGVNGYLIKPGDIKNYAKAVIDLANDMDLRKKFGAAAKVNSQKFLPEKIALKWKNLFEKLCSDSVNS